MRFRNSLWLVPTYIEVPLYKWEESFSGVLLEKPIQVMTKFAPHNNYKGYIVLDGEILKKWNFNGLGLVKMAKIAVKEQITLDEAYQEMNRRFRTLNQSR